MTETYNPTHRAPHPYDGENPNGDNYDGNLANSQKLVSNGYTFECYEGTFKNGEYDGYLIFSGADSVGRGYFNLKNGRLNGKGFEKYDNG